jgi:hypothetical protein
MAGFYSAVDSEGSSCRIDDAIISSPKYALKVDRASGCTVSRSTLTSDNPTTAVILVNRGSSVQLTDNDISHTAAGGTALGVGQGASVELWSEAGGNTLAGDGFAVQVYRGGNLMQGYGTHDTIDGDVEIWASGHVHFLDATINGNIDVDSDSYLRLRNRTDSAETVVYGNIILNKDSHLHFKMSTPGHLVVVNGDVTCNDQESSYRSVNDDINTLEVTGDLVCSGF